MSSLLSYLHPPRQLSYLACCSNIPPCSSVSPYFGIALWPLTLRRLAAHIGLLLWHRPPATYPAPASPCSLSPSVILLPALVCCSDILPCSSVALRHPTLLWRHLTASHPLSSHCPHWSVAPVSPIYSSIALQPPTLLWHHPTASRPPSPCCLHWSTASASPHLLQHAAMLRHRPMASRPLSSCWLHWSTAPTSSHLL